MRCQCVVLVRVAGERRPISAPLSKQKYASCLSHFQTSVTRLFSLVPSSSIQSLHSPGTVITTILHNVARDEALPVEQAMSSGGLVVLAHSPPLLFAISATRG
jgi:hypothetical protein